MIRAMMGAVLISETSVCFYETTRRYIQEGRNHLIEFYLKHSPSWYGVGNIFTWTSFLMRHLAGLEVKVAVSQEQVIDNYTLFSVA
jgi:hypothetical protein